MRESIMFSYKTNSAGADIEAARGCEQKPGRAIQGGGIIERCCVKLATRDHSELSTARQCQQHAPPHVLQALWCGATATGADQ